MKRDRLTIIYVKGSNYKAQQGGFWRRWKKHRNFCTRPTPPLKMGSRGIAPAMILNHAVLLVSFSAIWIEKCGFRWTVSSLETNNIHVTIRDYIDIQACDWYLLEYEREISKILHTHEYFQAIILIHNNNATCVMCVNTLFNMCKIMRLCADCVISTLANQCSSSFYYGV